MKKKFVVFIVSLTPKRQTVYLHNYYCNWRSFYFFFQIISILISKIFYRAVSIMAFASGDVDFNKLIREDQTICAICFFSWIERDARCLPCKEKVHIFCSDCLKQLAHHDNSINEGILLCPICKMAHRWTDNGVTSFPKLGLLKITDQNDESRLKYKSRIFNDSAPNHTRSYVEDIIVSVLRNLQNQEIKLLQKINETAAKHIESVRRQRHNLLEEVLKFFDEKETELIDIVREFDAFENFSKKVGETVTNKKITAMKIKLNNKANSCYHRNIEFFKNSNIDSFSLGLNRIDEEFKVAKELYRLPTGGKVCNTAFFDNTLYLITKKFGGSLYFYKLLKYTMESGITKYLHEWNNPMKIEYKLAVSVNIYLLTVGEIKVQYASEINQDDGKYSCSFSTFYDIIRRKHDTTTFVHLIAYDKGIVLCCRDSHSVFTFKKIRDPVKQKWKISLTLPLLNIIDMRINSSQLFTLFTENLYYVFDLNSGKILNKLKTSSSGCPREVLGITKYRFCTKILFQTGCCLIGNDFVRLIDKTEDNVSSWSYKKIFDLYQTIEYGKTSEGIVTFLILEKWINMVYLKYIKC